MASYGTLTIFAGGQEGASGSISVADAIREQLGKIKPHDYIALLAYVEETPEIDAAIQSIRKHLRDATHCATTTGYGPRFLHSTGQLHKGGPDSGVFFQLAAPDKVDLPVPGSPKPAGSIYRR